MYDYGIQAWTNLKEMKSARQRHGCGTARKADGTEVIVVAGGYLWEMEPALDSVEVYDAVNNQWR